MKEGRSFKAVGGSAGSLHSIGHSRWSTREDTDLGKEDVLFLEVVKEGIEVRTTEVGDGTKTGEQALARQLLEIALADVLCEGKKKGKVNSCNSCVKVNTFLINVLESECVWYR